MESSGDGSGNPVGGVTLRENQTPGEAAFAASPYGKPVPDVVHTNGTAKSTEQKKGLFGGFFGRGIKNPQSSQPVTNEAAAVVAPEPVSVGASTPVEATPTAAGTNGTVSPDTTPPAPDGPAPAVAGVTAEPPTPEPSVAASPPESAPTSGVVNPTSEPVDTPSKPSAVSGEIITPPPTADGSSTPTPPGPRIIEAQVMGQSGSGTGIVEAPERKRAGVREVADVMGHVAVSWLKNADPRNLIRESWSYRIGYGAGLLESAALSQVHIPIPFVKGRLKYVINAAALDTASSLAEKYYQKKKSTLESKHRDPAELEAHIKALEESHTVASARIRKFAAGMAAGSTVFALSSLVEGVGQAAGEKIFSVDLKGEIGRIIGDQLKDVQTDGPLSGVGGVVGEKAHEVASNIGGFTGEKVQGTEGVISGVENKLNDTKDLAGRALSNAPGVSTLEQISGFIGDKAQGATSSVGGLFEDGSKDARGLASGIDSSVKELSSAVGGELNTLPVIGGHDLSHTGATIVHDGSGQPGIGDVPGPSEAAGLASGGTSLPIEGQPGIGDVPGPAEVQNSLGGSPIEEISHNAGPNSEQIQRIVSSDEFVQSTAAAVGKEIPIRDQIVAQIFTDQKIDPNTVPPDVLARVQANVLSGMQNMANESFQTNAAEIINSNPGTVDMGQVIAAGNLDFLHNLGQQTAHDQLAATGHETLTTYLNSQHMLDQAASASVGEHLQTVHEATNEALNSAGISPNQLSAIDYEHVSQAIQHSAEKLANQSYAQADLSGNPDLSSVVATGHEQFSQAMADPNIHEQLVQAGNQALHEVQQSHMSVQQHITETLSSHPTNVAEAPIASGNNVSEMLAQHGMPLAWNSSDSDILAAHIATNYDLLSKTWSDVLTSGQAPDGMHFPMSLSELNSIAEKAKAGDPEALRQLQEALHWIPANDKFKILDKAGVDAVMGSLKQQ